MLASCKWFTGVHRNNYLCWNSSYHLCSWQCQMQYFIALLFVKISGLANLPPPNYISTIRSRLGIGRRKKNCMDLFALTSPPCSSSWEMFIDFKTFHILFLRRTSISYNLYMATSQEYEKKTWIYWFYSRLVDKLISYNNCSLIVEQLRSDGFQT